MAPRSSNGESALLADRRLESRQGQVWGLTDPSRGMVHYHKDFPLEISQEIKLLLLPSKWLVTHPFQQKYNGRQGLLPISRAKKLQKAQS